MTTGSAQTTSLMRLVSPPLSVEEPRSSRGKLPEEGLTKMLD